MIVIVLTLLTLASWFLIKPKAIRRVVGTIFSALLLLSAIAIIANTSYHFGMSQEVETKETSIYTAGQLDSPVNILIANQIGTDSDNYAMSFRESKDQEQPITAFVPDQHHMAEAVKKSANYQVIATDEPAKIKTTTTKWQYNSELYKSLFKVDDTETELISETNEVTLPQSNWLVLSADQTKTLTEKQQAMTDAQKQAQQTQLKQAVATQIQSYQAQNPATTQAQLADYTQKVTTELTLQAMKSLIE
ncbi:DUF4811 domain-containing protein [Holzapfeliella sp. He02]|uniref:DUF4811 domain-containing protein n=1 Tax=Holzapfeliella saturejae TaxID=3082953 RepID=A0ABU8SGU3_9LACO